MRWYAMLPVCALAACSSGGEDDVGTGARDTGVAADTGVTAADTGVVAADTGVAPSDTGVAPSDTGVAPSDTGVIPSDTGVIPSDTGVTPSDGGVAADAGPPADTGPTDTGATTFGCGLPPGPLAPGEITCPGCPTSAPPITTFSSTVGATTFTMLTGGVTGAAGNGQFFVLGAAGRQLFGTVPVAQDGSYGVTVPLFCGAQQVVTTFCNASGRTAIVRRVFTSACTEPDIRATILWDEIGDDWELHLIKPGGRINDNATDCTWTSCINSQPDWGVIGDPTDDPKKDVDDVDAYGPENILLSRPENGTYTVMVEHWGPGSPMSDGNVILNVAGQVVVVDIVDFQPQFVRTAATIEWPSGLVRTSTALHDCTQNWSGGCRDPIP